MEQERSTQTNNSGILERTVKGLSSNIGTIVAGLLVAGGGMLIEANTHYVQQKKDEITIVRYVMQGYAISGDPLYRNAEIALKIDDDKRELYGVLRDESRGIELKINEGLQTKKSFHVSISEKVQKDLDSLGQGIEKLGYEVGQGGERMWEEVKSRYETLSKKIGKEIDDLTD